VPANFVSKHFSCPPIWAATFFIYWVGVVTRSFHLKTHGISTIGLFALDYGEMFFVDKQMRTRKDGKLMYKVGLPQYSVNKMSEYIARMAGPQGPICSNYRDNILPISNNWPHSIVSQQAPN
jgi:hypothetical protein